MTPRRAAMRIVIVAAALAAGFAARAADAPARPAPLRSGASFTGADVRALESDDFRNPGMLWVERGERLWSAKADGQSRACADCHGGAPQSMKGVAARYPVFDVARNRLLNVEGRINACRVEHQGAPALEYESADLLALTAYVAYQSRGLPLAASIDGPARASFDAGAALYRRRIGQVDLACTQCHDRLWGRRLLAETISQGHPNGFPAYRMEWQSLGSLHRRLRACLSGIRAEMWPYGAEQYLQLELYLAWRGRGLPVETPAVRR